MKGEKKPVLERAGDEEARKQGADLTAKHLAHSRNTHIHEHTHTCTHASLSARQPGPQVQKQLGEPALSLPVLGPDNRMARANLALREASFDVVGGRVLSTDP